MGQKVRFDDAIVASFQELPRDPKQQSQGLTTNHHGLGPCERFMVVFAGIEEQFLEFVLAEQWPASFLMKFAGQR